MYVILKIACRVGPDFEPFVQPCHIYTLGVRANRSFATFTVSRDWLSSECAATRTRTNISTWHLAPGDDTSSVKHSDDRVGSDGVVYHG